jgi:hypothetical protein
MKFTRALALTVLLAGCGVVYTNDAPDLYYHCVGASDECTCDPEPTTYPDVTTCTAVAAAGACCQDPSWPNLGGASGCACVGLPCTDAGDICQCAVLSTDFIGTTVSQCLPRPGDSCCLSPGDNNIGSSCSCSSQPCDSLETQVDACTPALFTCDLLAQDGYVGDEFYALTQGTDTCADGPATFPDDSASN